MPPIKFRPVLKTNDEAEGTYHQYRKGSKVVFRLRGHNVTAKVDDRKKQFCKVRYMDQGMLSTAWFSVGGLMRADVAKLNPSLYPLILSSIGLGSYSSMRVLLVESK